MSLHSDFAGVLSVRLSLAQKILHTYYCDDDFNANLAGDPVKLPDRKNPETNEDLPNRYIAFDLFMAEPLLSFAERSDGRIGLHIRMNGKLFFSSTTIESIENTVQMDFDIFPSIETFDTGTSLQFGVNTAGAPVENFICNRLSGADPEPTYFYNLEENLASSITLAIWTMDTSKWRFTPPGFDELRSIGLITSQLTQVRTFGEVATIGVDITGLTEGNAEGLDDLLNANVERGFKSTYSESIHTADDEFGEPIYETAWTKVKKRTNGSHQSNIAFSINRIVMNELYEEIFRQMIFDEFEQEKQDAIDRAIATAEEEGEEYSEPQIAKVDLIDLNMDLANDHIYISGEADYDGINITFSLKMRFVRTLVDGSTAFVNSHQDLCGLRPEIYDIEIDTPWWITFIQVLVGIAGVALAPFTFVMSAYFSIMIIVILGSVVSGFLGAAGNRMKLAIARQLSSNHGRFKFILPDTEAPEFTLEPDDIVVNHGGIDTWLWILDKSSSGAKLKMDKYENYTTWPVKDRNEIIVSADIPKGYYHPDDNAVRIRWRVYAETNSNKIIEKDVKIKKGLYSIGSPKKIIIDHAKQEWDAYESFIVKCRIYRPWGVATQEIWKGELTIKIEDRLHRDKPYVRWERKVFYKNYSAKLNDPDRTGLGWAEEWRKYAIHKTDPDERCRFADGYTKKLTKDELIYLDELPFSEKDIKKNLNQICEYCFFGGPDKVNPKPPKKKKHKTSGNKFDFKKHFKKKKQNH